MIIEHGYWDSGQIRSLPAHHNNGLELVFIEKGQVEWQVDGSSEWVGPGSLFFTLPWQQHGDSTPQHQGLQLYYVVLPLDKTYRKPNQQWVFHPGLQLSFQKNDMKILRAQFNTLTKHCWPATDAFASNMRQLHQELSQDLECHETQRAALVTALLISCLRSTQHRQPSTVDDATELVSTFLTELNARCHESWTLDRMAHACHLGRTQFAFHVQRLSGLSPLQYLAHQRIRRAQELLRYTQESITSIALDCGFDSSQYFARVFKKIVGCDARSYRQQQS